MKKPLTFPRSELPKSKPRIVSWAMKRKQKKLNQALSVTSSNVPLNCPLVGCSGFGHINGQDTAHVTLSGCPLYHNMSFEKWAEMRAREEGLVVPESIKRSSEASPSPSKCKHKIDRSHQFKTTQREPTLDDLASQVELYQFRRAQQRLVSTSEADAREHLLLCARVALNSRSSPNNAFSENIEFATEQRIRSVIFGTWDLQPWYQSNYPADLSCLPTIYVCEFCLTGMRHQVGYNRHKINCGRTFPPGSEIYRKENLSFFEVDGQRHQEYCRNLCLLAKLFLRQKTVHELDQVPAFLFYVLTETDQSGSHIIGYFSKQKAEDQSDNSANTVYNNLSCILILPPYQCRGFGRMLIEMSYVLSRLEQRIGTPERPLSDLGIIIYRRYWRFEILKYLSSFTAKSINIRTMSQELGIAVPDIVSTLLDMKMLVCYRTQYYIINNKPDIDTLLSTMKLPATDRCIDPSCLHWTPNININQSNKSPSSTSGGGSSSSINQKLHKSSFISPNDSIGNI
ncbi:Histone acetyltransferase KAT7 isoform 2 [Schistosoma japonicum]|uniref:Histone acetyltransferase n=2 Tax=Schistosoma japonicum TaxID=6182 RepID=A0A4Z2DHW9_SCHJA|nr:Histone acetyltransferase KAT7 isoform 2 [Schistosoma japonicum]